MITHLTRREMYELVWTERLDSVAQKLGVSHWRVKDLCVQHRVPLPTASYWRDKEAGKKPRQTIFASAADPAIELISLNPSTPTDPANEEHLKQARKAAALPRRLTRQRGTEPKTVEWDRVDKPHSSLTATAQALRRAKAEAGIVDIRGEGLLSLRLGATSVERAIFILDAIACRLETREMACTFAGKQAEVRRDVDMVPFILTETIRRQKHEPTIEELTAEERYRRSARYRDWATPYERQYPEFDFLPTGQLAISIETYGHERRRRNWRDNSHAMLEAQLDSVVEELVNWVEFKKDSRLKRERDQRLWRRADENRNRADARKKREGERDELLDKIVAMSRRAEQLRSWISWAGDIDDPDTRRMLGWARKRLAEIERALDPASFGDWLRERKLFPEVDPFAFLPSDPDLEPPL